MIPLPAPQPPAPVLLSLLWGAWLAMRILVGKWLAMLTGMCDISVHSRTVDPYLPAGRWWLRSVPGRRGAAG